MESGCNHKVVFEVVIVVANRKAKVISITPNFFFYQCKLSIYLNGNISSLGKKKTIKIQFELNLIRNASGPCESLLANIHVLKLQTNI